MATQTNSPLTDLVLRLSGGQRDGELLSVKTPKCFLGFQASFGSPQQGPWCAIFRGPNGVALRSYADEISVNGASVTVHWLEQGDQIKLPNATAVEVTQLGLVESPCDEVARVVNDSVADVNRDEAHAQPPKSDQTAEQTALETPAELQFSDSVRIVHDDESQPVSLSNECGSDNLISCELHDKNSPAALALDDGPELRESLGEPGDGETPSPDSNGRLDSVQDSNAASEMDRRLNWVESQIREIQGQNCLTQANFEQLNERLDALCCQISEMVSFPDRGGSTYGQLESETPPTLVTEVEPEETFLNFGQEQEELNLNSAIGAEAINLETESPDDEDTFSEPTSPVGDDLQCEYYSYAEDDSEDERIVTFDPESHDETETCDSFKAVDITEPAPELRGVSQAEIDERLAEMERVFSGLTTESESQIERPTPAVESLSSPIHPRKTTPTQPLNSLLETVMGTSHQPAKEHLMPNAADDQPANLFEFLTCSQNDGVESSAADPSADEEESFVTNPLAHECDERPCEPASFASQLLKEVETGEQAEDQESPTETIQTQSSVNPDHRQKKNESVAELLARLQSEGQWSGIPDGNDEPIESVEPAAHVPEPEHPAAAVEGGAEDDVEDYMSQLLSRMRGGAPVSQPKPVAKTKQPATTPAKKKEDDVIVPPTNPLKPEEFVPMRKAEKIQSFDAMRELANSSARRAVMESEDGRRKALGYLQAGISAASFAMSLYYLMVASKQLFDISFLIGFVCLSISGFLGYRYYLTIKDHELLEWMDYFGKSKPFRRAAKPDSESPPQP